MMYGKLNAPWAPKNQKSYKKKTGIVKEKPNTFFFFYNYYYVSLYGFSQKNTPLICHGLELKWFKSNLYWSVDDK